MLALLGRILPDSTPRWVQVIVFVVVIVALFLVNLHVIMPWIDRVRSRSKPGGDGPIT